MKSFKLLVMSLPLFIFFSSFQANAQEEKTIDVGNNFNTIKIFDGIQTELYSSDKNEVVITGIGENEVETEVEHGKLKIKMNLGNVWSESNTKVKVYFQSITDIDVNEGATVNLMETFKQSNLHLRAQEGSKIKADIDVENLSVKSVTGSKIELSGMAKNSKVNIKTGGEFDGEDLKTETTQVNVTAGGFAEINASDYVKAKVKVGGKIEIYGDPDKVDRKTTLGGKIINKK